MLIDPRDSVMFKEACGGGEEEADDDECSLVAPFICECSPVEDSILDGTHNHKGHCPITRIKST